MSSIKKADLSPSEKNRVQAGTLYLVATPIGNLADLSERAIKVLSEVDFIAAEDTRNSMRLLSHLGISKPLVSYFEHNKRERGEQITARLEGGESCALITDAGTPAIRARTSLPSVPKKEFPSRRSPVPLLRSSHSPCRVCPRENSALKAFYRSINPSAVCISSSSNKKRAPCSSMKPPTSSATPSRISSPPLERVAASPSAVNSRNSTKRSSV